MTEREEEKPTIKEKKQTLDFDIDNAIEQCIFGSTYDRNRARACFDLAAECHNKMYLDLSPSMREALRRKIIDDVSLINHEDLSDTYKVSGKDYPIIITEPHIFDFGYDPKDFVEEKKQDKEYGICSLSLYGMEMQFMEQLNKGMFQTEENAKVLKYIEDILLKESGEKEEYYERYYHICNDIINPKVEQGKYKICSEANLKNQQSFYIRKRELMEKGFKSDVYSDLSGVGMDKIWAYTKPEWKDILLTKAGITISIGEEERTWGDFTETEHEALFKTYHTYPNEEIPKMINPQQDEYRWFDASKLSCWHNFLQKQPLPEEISSAYLDVQLSLENGEISEEEAIRLIEQIGKSEKFIKLSAPYQPIRLRLWGSQRALNSLFHHILTENPFTLGTVFNNEESYQTISKGLDFADLMQLIKNEIYSKEEYNEKNIIGRIDGEDLWELLRPAAYKGVKNFLEDQVHDYARDRDIDSHYYQLAKIIGEKYDDIISDLEFAIPEKEDKGIEIPDNSYKVVSGTINDYEDEYDGFGESELDSYMKYINKKYPNLSTEEAWILMEIEHKYWYFRFNIDFAGYISYEDIEDKVSKYIDADLMPEIEELETEKEMRIDELAYIQEELKYEKKQIDMLQIPLNDPQALHYAYLEKDARDLDGRLKTITDEIVESEKEIAAIMVLLDKIADDCGMENTLKEKYGK